MIVMPTKEAWLNQPDFLKEEQCKTNETQEMLCSPEVLPIPTLL